MTNGTRAARIEAAADDCRDNAVATVIERMGQATVQALSFNDYLDVTDREKLAQAAYFADQHQVTTQEVLVALNLR